LKIAKIGWLNTVPLHWMLRLHPELWDTNTARTAPCDSPHHGLSDIWARYAAPGVDGSQPHESVWYDSPITPYLRMMSISLISMVSGGQLGGVLITRIPPGVDCKPHIDHGWHARHYEKVAVQIESAPGQAFCFHGEALETKPGDVFWFDNAHEHWVPNPSAFERITAIFCIRTKAFDVLKE
jgi:hypothetical protein